MAGRPIHTFEVISKLQLTPHMIRLVLGGVGLVMVAAGTYVVSRPVPAADDDRS